MKSNPAAFAVALGIALSSVAGHAAPRVSGFSAALASPAAQPRQQIVNGVLWKCADGRCSAAADGSRPMMACQRMVRSFGAVTRFTTPAGDLSAEDIERCNSAG